MTSLWLAVFPRPLPMGPPAEIALFSALLGACIGSFLNVAAWRLPREDSLLRPPSHCPRCGTFLAWYENLPVVGWLWLRGKCRHCGAPIRFRYPAVEALCAGLWVGVLLARPDAMGPGAAWPLLVVSGWILVSLLLLLALIDLDHLWIPEPLCRWGVVMGWLLTACLGWLQSPALARSLLSSHLLAAAMGLVGFELFSDLAARAMGRPALGAGDAKVAALLGAWLGPWGLALALALAVVLAAVVGGLALASGLIKRHQPIPFVPFLAVGGAWLWWSGVSPWMAIWMGWG